MIATSFVRIGLSCRSTKFVGAPLLSAKVDGDFLDLSGEFERHVVILADGRASVFANVKSFVCAEPVGNGGLDAALGHLLAVDAQRAGAALAHATAVILEVEHKRVVCAEN